MCYETDIHFSYFTCMCFKIPAVHAFKSPSVAHLVAGKDSSLMHHEECWDKESDAWMRKKEEEEAPLPGQASLQYGAGN